MSRRLPIGDLPVPAYRRTCTCGLRSYALQFKHCRRCYPTCSRRRTSRVAPRLHRPGPDAAYQSKSGMKRHHQYLAPRCRVSTRADLSGATRFNFTSSTYPTFFSVAVHTIAGETWDQKSAKFPPQHPVTSGFASDVHSHCRLSSSHPPHHRAPTRPTASSTDSRTV